MEIGFQRLIEHAIDVNDTGLAESALHFLKPTAGERILDVRCRVGTFLAALVARADCLAYGIDPSSKLVASARRRLGEQAWCQVANVEEAPFDDGVFDAILALNLPEVMGRNARLSSVRRLLRPGGRLIACASPLGWTDQLYSVGTRCPPVFDKQTLTEALHGAGFAPEGISVHALPIAPCVTGLFLVAFNQERSAWPTSQKREEQTAEQAG